jgi:acetyl-CoA synthetase
VRNRRDRHPKSPDDWPLQPNFTDYEQTRAKFDWSDVPDLCVGMPSAGCNIAYAAVDRHAEGPAASHTALRFLPPEGRDGAVAARDLSYAELGRLTRRFTKRPAVAGHRQGSPGLHHHGPRSELYITILGALRNGSIVSPLVSAFGPEPIATRIQIGQADVLVTTKAIYERKIAKIRDRLKSVRFVFVVDDDTDDDDARGTLNFWHCMDAADESAPIQPTTADDPALLQWSRKQARNPLRRLVSCNPSPNRT